MQPSVIAPIRHPRGNNRTPCCGREPMLRVRERYWHNAFVCYVQYECATCKRKGGLAIVEPEAGKLWEACETPRGQAGLRQVETQVRAAQMPEP